MATYIVTGRTFNVPERYEWPWNAVDLTPIGNPITLNLTTDEETAMIARHLLVPQAWYGTHTLTG